MCVVGMLRAIIGWAGLCKPRRRPRTATMARGVGRGHPTPRGLGGLCCACSVRSAWS